MITKRLTADTDLKGASLLRKLLSTAESFSCHKSRDSADGGQPVRHRRSRRALALLLLSIGIISATEPPSRREQDLHSIATSLEHIAGDLDAERDQRACPPDRQDRTSGLCAQWHAVDAALDSARQAEAANVIARQANSIGIATLIMAGLAALFSGIAAVAAWRQWRAERNRESLATEARVAIRVILGAQQSTKCQIAFLNGGPTTADDVEARLTIAVSRYEVSAADGRITRHEVFRRKNMVARAKQTKLMASQISDWDFEISGLPHIPYSVASGPGRQSCMVDVKGVISWTTTFGDRISKDYKIGMEPVPQTMTDGTVYLVGETSWHNDDKSEPKRKSA